MNNIVFKLTWDDEGQPITELIATDSETKSTEATWWIWNDFDDMFSDWLVGTIGDNKTPEPGIYYARLCSEPSESLDGEIDCDVWFEDLKPVYLSGIVHPGTDRPGDDIDILAEFAQVSKPVASEPVVSDYHVWSGSSCGSCGLDLRVDHVVGSCLMNTIRSRVTESANTQ